MGSKVLIIEDSKPLSLAIQAELKGQYEIQSDIAASLTEAKGLLETQSDDYFIATVDLQLPDCNDTDTIDLLAQYKIPSIVFTGQMNTNIREQFANKDLVDYVYKTASSGVHYVGWLINRVLANNQMLVLVVDDSPSARATLSALLSMQGFNVISAGDGKTGLEMLNEKPDIVILDEFLPDILGHDLCKDIRIKVSDPLLQIFGVSSKGDQSTASTFLKCGGDEFLLRPFNPEEFTNRINHRADYIDQVRALNKANSEKNHFLGMVVHDLRNPLSFVQQACKRIEKIIPNNEKLKNLSEMLIKSTNGMMTLLDDLLDISAIEMGKLQLHKYPLNLAEIITERVELQKIQANKKAIDITLKLPESAMVEVDPSRISQVIDNLISNAIKYSPHSKGITITLEKHKEKFRFNIVDHGAGIRDEDTKNLFKPFQRFGHKTTAGESSHGLGLSICLRVINAHEGNIGYQHADTGGSHFYFELPRN